ncbi:ABC transporter permease [Zavarzinia aquatilis]|uniref:ABC transporter permease n=1 Tax=Zavarzinia aquatilis TaxID=2211142 RepID=A0A317EE43_9PROT|nr:ABC transporter permease [Zavarzinia aquatilis]PWR25307.1 ABC transporter permease [Zavarzinia aquatilis]
MRIITRSGPSVTWSIAVYGAAAVVGLLMTIVLISISGAPVGASLVALGQGAAGSPASIASSVVKATPLILTGLATCVTYRAGLWTVGQESQVVAGAAAAWQMSLWTTGMAPVVVIVLCVLAALAGGAALGALVAWFRTRFGISEIVSSMMLNYIVFFALAWLISGPWMASGGTASYQQTGLLERAYWLPNIVDVGKMHIGVVLALIVVIWLQVLLKRMPLGYEIRAMGFNATALSQRGVDKRRLVLTVMVISGVIAALAGVGEVFGVSHRLTGDNLSGMGFDGIIIALIGGLSPLGTLVAGLFFGALHNGSLFMNVITGVPTALVTAIQGVVLILFLIAGAVRRYRIERA